MPGTIACLPGLMIDIMGHVSTAEHTRFFIGSSLAEEVGNLPCDPVGMLVVQ